MVGLCVFLSYPPEHKRWIPHVLSCKQAAWGGVCGTVWVCDVQTPSSGSVAKLFLSSLLSQSSIWCLCLVVERKLWCWALICTWYSRLCAKSNIHVLQNNSVVFFFSSYPCTSPYSSWPAHCYASIRILTMELWGTFQIFGGIPNRIRQKSQ